MAAALLDYSCLHGCFGKDRLSVDKRGVYTEVASEGYQSPRMLLNRCPSLLYTTRRALTIRHKSSKPAGQLDLADLPLRLAVIGSGPAGFYAASRILGLKGSQNVQIDMYEELPVPFGLVRYGVAPDHPEVKVGSHRLCCITLYLLRALTELHTQI